MVSGKSVELDTMDVIHEEAVEETPRPDLQNSPDKSFTSFLKIKDRSKKLVPEISQEQKKLEEQEKRE